MNLLVTVCDIASLKVYFIIFGQLFAKSLVSCVNMCMPNAVIYPRNIKLRGVIIQHFKRVECDGEQLFVAKLEQIILNCLTLITRNFIVHGTCLGL